ncbi:MAG: hypothetical protein LRY40_07080 [Shewanella fodinae]|nr:hypothetical protein [Shewanella fodinae]
MDGLHITKATIGSVRYDDQYWLKVNDETLVKRVSGSFPGGFPSESTTDCEQGQENLINVATDVTSEFQSALSQSTILNINQVVAVDGKGDGFADITLQFDQDVLFDWTEDVKETPDGCSAALDDPAAFCTASNWVCGARLNSDLVTDGGIINLSDIDGQSGVQSVAAQDDVIIMVLRREFDPTDATGYTSNCGNIMAQQTMKPTIRMMMACGSAAKA